MDEQLKCLRCEGVMQFAKNEKLQLGQHGWLLGDLPNLFAGALEVGIYVCKKCGKIEFYQTAENTLISDIAQKKCPSCGKTCDLDYPKCPYCKFDLSSESDFI
jgi:rubrerythrin